MPKPSKRIAGIVPLGKDGWEVHFAAWSLVDWPTGSELGARFHKSRTGKLVVREVSTGSPAWEALDPLTGAEDERCRLTEGDEINLLLITAEKQQYLYDPNKQFKALAEKYHPGSCKRPPNPLVSIEGQPAVQTGCVSCHAVGRPNADGSLGTCTACHARHTASVELARLPMTCAQCHMGPDHSQIEIYNESKHGVMFNAQRKMLNLAAAPAKLTTRDMFVPTCATCHMSGNNGLIVTSDPSERLSYKLFAEAT